LLLDGVLVVIVLPIREVRLELILLFVFLDERFVTTFSDLLLVRLFVLLKEFELLLEGVLVVIVLPIREVRLELTLPFELLRLLMLLLLERFEIEEFDRVLICRPSVLEFGAVIRELIDRFVARLVITLVELEVFLFVIALLEMLLLGVRLVIDLLEMLLLGVLLTDDRLELLLDETRLEERLDTDLDGALRAGADREALRLELLDLLELRLERDLAANTGSQNNKSANRVQKTRKSEPFCVLYPVFCFPYPDF